MTIKQRYKLFFANQAFILPVTQYAKQRQIEAVNPESLCSQDDSTERLVHLKNSQTQAVSAYLSKEN